MTEQPSEFIKRRYAQIYVEKFTQQSHQEAEAWVKGKIEKEDKPEFQKYIINELKNKGFTNIKPGKDK